MVNRAAYYLYPIPVRFVSEIHGILTTASRLDRIVADFNAVSLVSSSHSRADGQKPPVASPLAGEH
jgi:hypothetical protein